MKTKALKLTKEQQQAQKLINLLIQACWENEKFKREFIQNPIETIEKVTGIPHKLPTGCKVKVEDQSGDAIIYLNIPAKPKKL